LYLGIGGRYFETPLRNRTISGFFPIGEDDFDVESKEIADLDDPIELYPDPFSYWCCRKRRTLSTVGRKGSNSSDKLKIHHP
jgi:hypothetical protein